MIQAIKRYEAVWYAPDSELSHKGAAMVNFSGLGRQQPRKVAAARISGPPCDHYLSGCRESRRSVVMCQRRGFPRPDKVGEVERFNGMLEEHIPECLGARHLGIHSRSRDPTRTIRLLSGAMPAIDRTRRLGMMNMGLLAFENSSNAARRRTRRFDSNRLSSVRVNCSTQRARRMICWIIEKSRERKANALKGSPAARTRR